MFHTLMRAALWAIVAMAPAAAAHGADPLRLTVGMQLTGTAQWELTAMANLGIASKHNLQLELRPLASNQAGQVALQAGEVDVILSDFVWVALQRAQGNSVTMVPHSLAVGGLMVDPAGPVKSVADLKGRTIAASGTPVDKSWVLLNAYYGRLTGGSLTDDASVKFGAPPLIAQLLNSGRVDAALNYWSWNAREKLEGKKVLITVPEMLAGLGVKETPPLLGWTFEDQTAASKHEALKAFLDASFETKQVLLTNDSAWDGLREEMGIKDGDGGLFAALRDGYRDGIVRSYDPDHIEAAEQTFALLAKYGGKDVVGDTTALPDGTFYKGYRK